MLMFLQRWAHDHDIRLKLYSPRLSVRERLERGQFDARVRYCYVQTK